VDNAGPVVRELANRGVYVRHFGNPAFGIEDCLRVSVGTPDDNAVFAEELESILRAQERAA
jgi:histidinol-phosphate/aromatic aminotransferase/cobyric acid decarboxylase-like protein